MPEPLIHFIIPFIVLLLIGLSIKKSVLLSSIAILPDFDVLFHVHRSITHSAIFLILICIPIIAFVKLKYPNYFHDSITGSLVLLTHPILDVFHTYTPILYPLYTKSIYVVCELVTDMNNISDLRFLFDIRIGEEGFGIISSSIDGVMFSSLGVGISLVILTGIIAKWRIENGRNNRKEDK